MINIKQERTHPELNKLLGIIDDDYRTLRLFACRCAREVLPMLSEEHNIYTQDLYLFNSVIGVSERCANGVGSPPDLLHGGDVLEWVHQYGQRAGVCGDHIQERDTVMERAAHMVICAAMRNEDKPGWEVTMARDCADSAARCIGMIAAGNISKVFKDAVVSVSSPGIVADTTHDIARHIAAEAEADMRQWQVDVLKGMIADLYK